jgi:tape measure domain-containing protein
MAEVGVRIVGEDQASAALRSVAESSRNTAQEINSLGGSWSGLSNTIASGVVKGQAIIGFLQGTLSAISSATAGIRAFAQESENMNQSLEGVRMSFTVLTGSGETANKLLTDMKTAARETVLSFEEFRNASKYLLGFQFDAKDVVQITKDIGAAVYALGAQNMGGMERIIRALGQMKAQGRVSREELNQLAEVGLPAMKMLADAFGTTTAEMSNMIKNGTIPAEAAISGLLGQIRTLYGSQTDALSSSFEVMTSNFGDFVDQAQQALGSGIFETNKRRLQELTQIVGSPVFMKIATELGGRLGDAYRRFNESAVFPAIQAVQQFMNVLDINNPRPAVLDLMQNLEGIMMQLINQYFGGTGASVVRNFMSLLNQLSEGVISLTEGRNIYEVFDRISKVGQDSTAGQFVGILAQGLISLGQAFEGVQSIASPFINQTLNAFSDGMSAISSVVQQVSPSVRNNLNSILSAVGDLGRNISTAISTGDTERLMSTITNSLSQLWTWIDQWGARALDSLVTNMDRLFSGNFDDAPFLGKLSEIMNKGASILGQLGNAFASSFGEELFPMLSPRLNALGSWLQSQFGIIVDGVGQSMNERLPVTFQMAFNTATTSFQNWLSQLGQVTKQGLADWLMPNLSGSQMFSDYMQNENARISQEIARRNQVLSEGNSQLQSELQNLPAMSEYFKGLGDTSTLVAEFQSIQQNTAPVAQQTGRSFFESVVMGARESAQSSSYMVGEETTAAFVSTANDLASSGTVSSAWENVGRNMALSVSRGYQSGYSELTQNIQTSLGIPEINKQLYENVSNINTLSSRVYVLESAINRSSSVFSSDGNPQGPPLNSMEQSSNLSNGRSGTTNNNSVVNINITTNKTNANDLQSMAQYLMIRKSLNF